MEKRPQNLPVDPEKIQELIKKSHEAKQFAFCPYSNFRVGAALLADDGTIIQGCNVENASYTLGICAERCAIFKAVSMGYRNFTAIAISTDVAELYSAPCGACRQIMYEFGGDMEVYMTRPDDSYMKKMPLDILPHAFGPKELNMKKNVIVTNNNGDITLTDSTESS
ncbi:cytidine deaminase-like [Diadema antillarum]|uniref:cytidine deaminase-like n=1 Tax=Diadema antillarum TaxID=105358 RepID=UPI003A84A2F9